VTITVDLGGEKRLGEIAVKWEFPAKAFTISVSLVCLLANILHLVGGHTTCSS
jgi:hypothetical protein